MSKRASKNALHISFEALHVYAGDDNFQKTVSTGAEHARKWLGALELVYPDATFAIIAFVDDYSTSGIEKLERLSLIETIRSEFEKTGVVLDYIVFESDCAKTCHYLRTDLVPPPEMGEGAIRKDAYKKSQDKILGVNQSNHNVTQGRMNFNYVAESFDPDDKLNRAYSYTSGSDRAYRNDIGISIRIARARAAEDGNANDVIWSCPALAAWWQLIRFGTLRDLGEQNTDGAPQGSWVREHKNRPALDGNMTISLLEPSYISVEHAVRVILKNLVDIKPMVSKRLQIQQDVTNTQWVDKVRYIFHE